ncbi:hypothetical protein HOLleu_07927 [Holothuria leucospilota]|uniref:Uncharacterized protein n=1 Tax=Holothuria leucospilota TaxID=206669 RepID=A0A9Q1CGR0_HOLLE|nr:hypothetical protein HOLleu_07927 [Holothuria leucospilota]
MGAPCSMPTRIVTGLKVETIGGDGVEVNLSPVFAKFNLPVEEWHILTERDIEVWEHLKDVKLPKLGDIHGIDLLTGNNVPAANAPIEVKTGPLGSLTAATLAVRMVAIIQKEINMKTDRVLYSTDSTSVLRYICNDRARYHTFVANRIQVIREASRPFQWYHVDTKANRADLALRGV